MNGRVGEAPGIPAAGFTDPPRESQRVFRAVLDALSHPTRSYPVRGVPGTPAGIGAALGAVALTLLDEETAVWLGGSAADDDVTTWLAFHTGVRRASGCADADFVVARPADLPEIGRLALGTEEAPHRSATVLLDVRGCAGDARFRAEGPGIDGSAELVAPWAGPGFLDGWRANGALHPRGVDLVLVAEASVTALPRTTRLAPLIADTPEEG